MNLCNLCILLLVFTRAAVATPRMHQEGQELRPEAGPEEGSKAAGKTVTENGTTFGHEEDVLGTQAFHGFLWTKKIVWIPPMDDEGNFLYDDLTATYNKGDAIRMSAAKAEKDKQNQQVETKAAEVNDEQGAKVTQQKEIRSTSKAGDKAGDKFNFGGFVWTAMSTVTTTKVSAEKYPIWFSPPYPYDYKLRVGSDFHDMPVMKSTFVKNEAEQMSKKMNEWFLQKETEAKLGDIFIFGGVKWTAKPAPEEYRGNLRYTQKYWDPTPRETGVVATWNLVEAFHMGMKILKTWPKTQAENGKQDQQVDQVEAEAAEENDEQDPEGDGAKATLQQEATRSPTVAQKEAAAQKTEVAKPAIRQKRAVAATAPPVAATPVARKEAVQPEPAAKSTTRHQKAAATIKAGYEEGDKFNFLDLVWTAMRTEGVDKKKHPIWFSPPYNFNFPPPDATGKFYGSYAGDIPVMKSTFDINEAEQMSKKMKEWLMQLEKGAKPEDTFWFGGVKWTAKPTVGDIKGYMKQIWFLPTPEIKPDVVATYNLVDAFQMSMKHEEQSQSDNDKQEKQVDAEAAEANAEQDPEGERENATLRALQEATRSPTVAQKEAAPQKTEVAKPAIRQKRAVAAAAPPVAATPVVRVARKEAVQQEPAAKSTTKHQRAAAATAQSTTTKAGDKAGDKFNFGVFVWTAMQTTGVSAKIYEEKPIWFLPQYIEKYNKIRLDSDFSDMPVMKSTFDKNEAEKMSEKMNEWFLQKEKGAKPKDTFVFGGVKWTAKPTLGDIKGYMDKQVWFDPTPTIEPNVVATYNLVDAFQMSMKHEEQSQPEHLNRSQEIGQEKE